MADYSKLDAKLAALSAKVDEVLVKLNQPVPDEQPAIDAHEVAVDAILAKLP